jgi:hypothetical protein
MNNYHQLKTKHSKLMTKIVLGEAAQQSVSPQLAGRLFLKAARSDGQGRPFMAGV